MVQATQGGTARFARWSGATSAAYAATILFTVSLARFSFIPRLGLPADAPLVAQLNGGLLPVAAHLLIFPLVAALPAPPWAKAAGYGWLVSDIATDIMALQGVADTTYLPLRYGGHVVAALWIALASWRAGGRCASSACSWPCSSAASPSSRTGHPCC